MDERFWLRLGSIQNNGHANRNLRHCVSWRSLDDNSFPLVWILSAAAMPNDELNHPEHETTERNRRYRTTRSGSRGWFQ